MFYHLLCRGYCYVRNCEDVVINAFMHRVSFQKSMNPDETLHNRPRSAVRNMPGYRCMSDCRSRGRKFIRSPVTYIRRDRSSFDHIFVCSIGNCISTIHVDIIISMLWSFYNNNCILMCLSVHFIVVIFKASVKHLKCDLL